MRLREWTVGKKLWLLAAMNVALLIAIETSNFLNSGVMADHLNDIGRTQLPVVRSMTLVDMMHDGLRAVVFRSLIAAHTHDVKEVSESKKEYAEFSEKIGKYLDDIRQSRVQTQIKVQIEDAMPVVQSYVRLGQEVVDLAETKGLDEALKKVPEYEQAFERLEDRLSKIGDLIEAQAEASVQASTKSASFWGVLIAVVGSLTSLALFYWINRDLVRTLKGMVDRLSDQRMALKSQTEAVEDSARNLATESSHQNSAVQNTASAMEQINAMVEQTQTNAGRLIDSARLSRQVVEEGQSAVQKMRNEMDVIKSSNSEVVRQIEEGNERIKSIVQVISEIGEKTKVINDIVFQTKLLSFNASVEAARAGEHGKGFAVVAEEVGNLATMSGTAAKEISKMLDTGISRVTDIVESNRERVTKLVDESTTNVESGRQVADQCGFVFNKIVAQSSEVAQLSSEISTSIQEQRAALQEISKAVDLFSHSTQANSITAQSASEVSQQLKESFGTLNELMSDLDGVVNGGREFKATLNSESQSGSELDSSSGPGSGVDSKHAA